MTDLRGERVRLRPLRPDEFELVRGGVHVSEAGSERFLRDRLERSGELVGGWLDLGIEVDGELVGDIGARAPHGAFPPGVFEIGITIFASGNRGRGVGREAVALFTEHLFTSQGAARVQATTVRSNTAMRAVLTRLGFAEEGILHGFMPNTAGGREDSVMYAVTREGWHSS